MSEYRIEDIKPITHPTDYYQWGKNCRILVENWETFTESTVLKIAETAKKYYESSQEDMDDFWSGYDT